VTAARLDECRRWQVLDNSAHSADRIRVTAAQDPCPTVNALVPTGRSRFWRAANHLELKKNESEQSYSRRTTTARVYRMETVTVTETEGA
jgi:hypothetical protein